ncbi:MAG: cation diffusion facilitator family transporter [Lactobacillales bacterium]|jgi:cation diffusion facilitator family transporter|nr:cation diffusion facilitator family transporter [Lactobacillales bacterium]
MEKNRYEELKTAEKGAVISIIAYIVLATSKIIIGNWANSNALRADGLNNFTDILSSLAVLIGLRISRRPPDDDHAYGHWKLETVASMITSFIMLMVGLEVLGSAITKIVHHTYSAPDAVSAWVGIFSAIVMYAVYFYNKRLAKKVKSPALLAAAKDNLSDAWTSIGTSVAIFAAIFKINILDSIAAVVIAILILKTAFDIFRESAFSLSDGFNEELLPEYKKLIMSINGVKGVRTIRGRTYGANIFLDVVVLMDPTLTVMQSHYITEIIEKKLQEEYGIFDTDVHVEPYLANTAK